jgi:hypothetical protein
MAKELLDRLGNWYDRNFNSGYRYAMDNPYIKLNTYYLNNYADRLEAIIRRISNLDRRLDSLYDDLIKDMDIVDLWNLFKSDLLTGHSRKLQRCVNYLKNTASDFERVESKIISELGSL